MRQDAGNPTSDTVDLREWFGVLYRRRGLFLLTSGILFAASLAAAILWPATYRSVATVLIEQQEVAPEFVRSAVSTSAIERIESISQRVMTRANLLAIVDKHGLFAEARAENRIDAIVEGMRRRIRVETVDVDVVDPRSGRPGRAAIAFTISYVGRNPEQTRTVAEELAALFLQQNRQSRAESASGTVAFLSAEAGLLSGRIIELEARIAAFKERNATELPELADLNLRLMESAERRIADVDSQLRSLAERRRMLEGDLAQVSPWGPMLSTTGEPAVDPAARLRALHSEYVGLSARYTASHPDVVRLQREIAALEGAIGTVDLAGERQREMTRLRDELVVALDRYSEAHPDVVRLRRAIAVLEATPDQSPPDMDDGDRILTPDNPAYITLRARLDAVDGELASLGDYRSHLAERLADYERRIVAGPVIERDYLALNREYEAAVARYREIRSSENDARLRLQLEAEHAEHFSLIDPPQVPESPIRPNRTLIGMVGLLFSLTGGVGAVATAEALAGRAEPAPDRRLQLAEQTITALQREVALLKGDAQELPQPAASRTPPARGGRRT